MNFIPSSKIHKMDLASPLQKIMKEDKIEKNACIDLPFSAEFHFLLN